MSCTNRFDDAIGTARLFSNIRPQMFEKVELYQWASPIHWYCSRFANTPEDRTIDGNEKLTGAEALGGFALLALVRLARRDCSS
ncbi:hypothetical protein [Paratractidigestivibacter sp.]|uniref:hypothetical protein n=1 Tax=Paratractidigestivibacter sp. TaxID=2847316 RepID=UPI002AC9DCD3|nr:hypothetical protein [Paratractidigestivibacter sp.]